MDRVKEIATLLKRVTDYKKGKIEESDLIKDVCSFFDEIKQETLNPSDRNFLLYLSNLIGIPHYIDTLKKFDNKIEIENFNLNSVAALIYESTLHTDENTKVHKFQFDILNRFSKEKQNRFFLSASTSFGKTHIVYEILKKMEYTNIVLIFPTIALLSENLERIISHSDYSFLSKNYAIHTLSDIKEYSEKNIFILTPERFLSMIERSEFKLRFDFAFVDEVYKIDNDYLIDEDLKENERDVAYRLAIHYMFQLGHDALLAGPYIEFYNSDSPDYNSSFDLFLKEYDIQLVNFNEIEIVGKSYHEIKSAKEIQIDKNLKIGFKTKAKMERLKEILNTIDKINENSIVYCSTKSYSEKYVKSIISSKVFEGHISSSYDDFINHISTNFGKDWTLVKALKNGVAYHHSLIPKYIQKEIINLFNNNQIKALFSTTTITEGVNTTAKNLVVLQSKKGNKDLKKFDAKNIAGRAGRFLSHFSGRVIILQNDFMKAIHSDAKGIKHKIFDINSPKDDIDIFYTKTSFLKTEEKKRVNDIKQKQKIRGIPDFAFEYFKVVSRSEKILVYDEIGKLSIEEFKLIKKLISTINSRMNIDYDGFEVILKVIRPIVRNKKLIFLMDSKDRNGVYSVFTTLVFSYLNNGFFGSINYKTKVQGKEIDKAIKETAEFVYNILKYQAVKYLGVFNLMYRIYRSIKENETFEGIKGIDPLLTKLEHNAFTENGRIASDYGVPNNVLRYYEAKSNKNQIKNSFDNYERIIFKKIEKVIGNDL